VRDKLDNGYYPDDSDIFVMQRAYDHIALKRSEIGSRLASVRSEETAQTNKVRKQKSDIEDADISESITEYTRYRLAYEALMRVIGDQKDMTILKYI